MTERLVIKSHFLDATSSTEDRFDIIRKNIKLLMSSLEQYDTRKAVNNPVAEKDIKQKFHDFLTSCGFYMAALDLDDLIDEISNKPRDDGSIAWYHQLSQVLTFLSLVQDSTISLQSLEKYGGLETAIRTGLRHDSIEDFGTDFKQFEEYQRQKIKITFDRIKEKNIGILDDTWHAKEEQNLKIFMQNLELITKKVAVLDENGKPQFHDDGRMIKKDLFPSTRDYTHNLVGSEKASPIVMIFKILDGSHNLSTMVGAPKFSAPRRLKYSNEREDMFGARQGLPEIAMRKWPKFKSALKKADDLMGAVLYTNFGYLEYVDQEAAYPDDKEKHRDGRIIYQSGVGRYLPKALSIKIPRAFNMFHTLLDTIQDLTHEHESDLMKTRTSLFWEKSLKPALLTHADHFPHIFIQGNTGGSFKIRDTNFAPQFL